MNKFKINNFKAFFEPLKYLQKFFRYFSQNCSKILFKIKCLMGMKIIINGSSSSGKSTTINYIQQKDMFRNWIHFGIDNLWGIIAPKHMINNEENGFKLYEKNGSINLHRGNFANDLLKKFFSIIEIFSKGNTNILVDEVIKDKEHMNFLLERLDVENTFFIKLFCSKEKLIERELFRKDRMIGLAISEADQIEKLDDLEYDLVLETTNTQIHQIGEEIIQFINNNEPKALQKLKGISKDNFVFYNNNRGIQNKI